MGMQMDQKADAKADGAEDKKTPVRKGKRELNAQAVRQKILDASRQLFSEIGYEAATITKIRHIANVSIATFYKYFDSKQTVLLALLSDEHDVYGNAVATAIAGPIDDPVDYIVSVIGAALDPPEQPSHKAMWREIVAAVVLQSREEKIATELTRDREFYCAQMTEALGKLIASGKVSPDVPVAGLSTIIYCISAMEFQEYVCLRYESRAAFFTHLRSVIMTAVAPWLTKTEA